MDRCSKKMEYNLGLKNQNVKYSPPSIYITYREKDQHAIGVRGKEVKHSNLIKTDLSSPQSSFFIFFQQKHCCLELGSHLSGWQKGYLNQVPSNNKPHEYLTFMLTPLDLAAAHINHDINVNPYQESKKERITLQRSAIYCPHVHPQD